MKLIDKNEVENILRNLWKKDDGHNPEHRICYNKALQEVQCELDTVETKEVDLEKELGKYLDANDIEFSHQIKLLDFAKHSFELGLKAQKGE